MKMKSSVLLAVMSALCVVTNAYWYPEPDTYTCCASGDPHYHLFDGQWIHYQGECKYLLAGTCHDCRERCSDCDGAPFQVYVDNEPVAGNPSVSRTDLVEIHFAGQVITFQAGQPAKVNGVVVALPYFGVPGAAVTDPIGNGNKFVFQTTDGLIVSYEHNHRACVTVPNCKYRGQMCGICGNMNNIKDDYVTSDGTDVSGAPNKFNLIGDSWKVAGGECPSDSTPPATPPAQDYVPPIVASPCCAVLDGNVDSPFINCIKANTDRAREFRDACLYDVGADQDNAMGCCAMMQAFADDCVARNLPVAVNWRDDIPGCGCTPPKVYTDDMPACPLTCPRTAYPSTTDCRAYMGPGCTCPSGWYLYRDGTCRQGCFDVQDVASVIGRA